MVIFIIGRQDVRHITSQDDLGPRPPVRTRARAVAFGWMTVLAQAIWHGPGW